MSKKQIATGSVSILDLNDAIIAGEAPSNPTEGQLWIDTSKTPNVLYIWNGSAWVEQHLSIDSLDPEFAEEIKSLKELVDAAASDGILSSSEKLNIKLLLVELTGQNVTGDTMPTLAQIDAKAGGTIYKTRASAIGADVNIPTVHPKFTLFETAYNNLKKYLESLNPRPWNTGNTPISPTEWATKWTAFYDAMAALDVVTAAYLSDRVKPNVDYNGTVITKEDGIVVTKGDKLIRTTLNATKGFSLQKRPDTSSAWQDMFYVGTDGFLHAKGLRIDSTSSLNGSSVSNVVNNAAAGATANATLADMANDNKLTPSEKLSLKKDFDAIVKEKPVLVEEANLYKITTELTNYNTAYNELNNLMSPLLSDVTITSGVDGGLMRTRFSAYSEKKAQLQKAISQAAKSKIENIQIGGRNLIRTANVAANSSTATYDAGTNTWTITGTAGAGGSWGCGLVIKNKDAVIPYGKTYILSFEILVPRACSWNTDVNNYAVTGSSWSGNDNDHSSARETSGKTLVANQWIKCWSKYSNTSPNNTSKVDIYDASNFGVVMQNETSNMTYKIRNVMGELATVPSEWSPAVEDIRAQITSIENELSSLEEDVAGLDTTLQDIASDNKLTPSEKQVIKKDLDEIDGEYTTIVNQATYYGITTEKTNYTTSYNNLKNYVGPAVTILTTTTTIDGVQMRNYFKDYYSKKATLLKKISDMAKDIVESIEIGSRNLVKYTKTFKPKNNTTQEDGWESPNGWTFAKDNEGFTVASKSQTGFTSDSIASLYSTKFPVKTGDEVVFSCYVKVDNLANWDVKNPYIFEVLNESGTRTQYQDVNIGLANTNKPTPVAGQWFHFYSAHKITVADAATCRVRLSLFRNGSIHIKKVKAEFGNFKPTDWTPAPEDTEERVDSVVDENGEIKSEDIARAFKINTNAASIISDVIDLSGKVSFTSFARLVKDTNGNYITNKNEPDYDPNFPKYLGTDGRYYRWNEFMSDIFVQEGDKTVIEGGQIKTGSIKADKINFLNAKVDKNTYDSSGNLISSETTFEIKDDGSVFSAGTFQSLNYEPQTAGWIINENGEAEFNNAYFRGDVILPNAGVTSSGRPAHKNYVLNTSTPHTRTSFNGNNNHTSIVYYAHKTLSKTGGRVVTVSFDYQWNSIATVSGQTARAYIQIESTNPSTSAAAYTGLTNLALTTGAKHFKQTITIPETKGEQYIIQLRADYISAGSITFRNFIITDGTEERKWTPSQHDALKEIRFWAGADFDNKETAPFRVEHDGSLYATKGHFGGTFSGIVKVGNILISDDATKTGDAVISINDHSNNNKIYLGESLAKFNTNAYFGTAAGTFLHIDSTNKKLVFGSQDFQIDYTNNKIKMKDYAITGNNGFIFESSGNGAYDFQFKSTSGSGTATALVDGTLSVSQDIEYKGILKMRRATDSGNTGVDFVFS